MREREIKAISGWAMVVILGATFIASVVGLVRSGQSEDTWFIAAWALVAMLSVACLFGLVVVNPNEARVVQLAGVYKGTVRQQGFWWVNPITSRRRVSLRVRNFETNHLKVNDHDGNPIEIAAVVVWRVVDTAEAIFQVNDYENFLRVQSESAVRVLATTYPYDAHEEGQIALRISAVEIAHKLREEIQERLSQAGIEVIEARISHLAYAPEIASAMLRRQQANAIIAARKCIVEGAVSMVEMALEQLSARHVVELDEERKAAMVSNLLVVLCGDRDPQPVVNAGTLYQ
jgi:regulator of protease activity HflC (stomatin/prohibitin superfamily)